MEGWDDDPGSVEALLHVDAQLHDDPHGYTSWEASGPLARLLQVAAADDATCDADAEATAVAGFNIARALDDDNFHAGGRHRSGRPRRAVSRAAVAGALAAGVVAATSGLAAAHTSVARVISDIASGLSSVGPPPKESHHLVPAVAGAPGQPAASAQTPAISSGSRGSAVSCPPGVAATTSDAIPSGTGACGTVSYGVVSTTVPPAAHPRRAKATDAASDVPTGPVRSDSAGAKAGRGSALGGGAQPGSGGGGWDLGSGSGSRSGGGSAPGTGAGPGPGTGDGTGPGPRSGGGHHHHHHHHHGHDDTTSNAPQV